MDPRDVTNSEQARAIVEQRGLDHVKVGVFDIDGILRGKYMARDKFFSALDKGFGFCDVIFGWDSNDELYDTKGIPEKQLFTGWHSGFPDVNTSIIPGSARDLPLEENIPLFLAELTDAEVWPRGLLKKELNLMEKDKIFSSSATVTLLVISILKTSTSQGYARPAERCEWMC